MKETKKMPSLTIVDGDLEVVYKFDYSDPDLNDWYQAFKTCLIGITFHENVINKGIIDIAEGIADDIKYNDQCRMYQ